MPNLCSPGVTTIKLCGSNILVPQQGAPDFFLVLERKKQKWILRSIAKGSYLLLHVIRHEY